MKKRILFISAIVVSLALGGGAFALTNSSPTVKKAAIVKSVSTATTPEVTPEEDTQTTAPVESEPVTPPPAPVTYGESPDTAGVYIVFDKTSVMNAAGVPVDQQANADRLISVLSNWTYKSTAEPLANLCRVRPASLMASAGDDYATNPITQLKWCNDFLLNRHGTWLNAMAWYQVHGVSFGTGQ